MSHEAWVILGTGLLAFLIAWLAMLESRRVARQTMTFNHFAKVMADRDMIVAKNVFVRLSKQPAALAALAKNSQDPDAQRIGRVLNNWELISIGIQMNIIDFEVVKRFNKSTVIDHYDKAVPFIHEIRRQAENRMLYHEFEELARWLRDDKPPQRIRGDQLFVRRRWVILSGLAVFSFVLGMVVANMLGAQRTLAAAEQPAQLTAPTPTE